MAKAKLFTPVQLGDIALKNRVLMAPLTRNRARSGDDAPYDIHVTYYGQRAGAGLIFTEATQISPQGKGYDNTPGIYSKAQIEGWKAVTDAVHAKGGKIILQLWHVGRISHPDIQEGGLDPVAPSAIAAQAQTFVNGTFVDTPTPRALETSEIPGLVEDFRRAAENAKTAGFDGVEVHAANGYLLDQFIRDGANKRDDAYGGSVENRVRFLAEVLDAVIDVWGRGRVGVRLSPFNGFNGIEDSDPDTTFAHVIDVLNEKGVAYLHMVEGQMATPQADKEREAVARLRARFKGAYIANNSYDRAMAIDEVETGMADAVAFGRSYIANPDLAERLERNAPLNTPDHTTFYGGTEKGYTDYPFLNDTKAA
ncbi:alkene reductase [Roseibium aquae]|uniref:Alkene reductase n=1 Tax=Roseibium aquae TaxID=1323746 RepID=A0A916WXD9_9HYPH|nr:alkene reductase [Roseibium aquae]GGB41349.1 alkene reductase [Roseibium aquae]